MSYNTIQKSLYMARMKNSARKNFFDASDDEFRSQSCYKGLYREAEEELNDVKSISDDELIASEMNEDHDFTLDEGS